MTVDISKNLWPDDFGTIAVLSPIAILRQQAAALGARTANIVVGRVYTQSGEIAPQGFRQVFSLYCNPLSYVTTLFYVDHGVELYPATITIEGEQRPFAEAADPNDFEEKLKEVFASPRTKKIIASLLAQSTQ